MWPYGFMAIVIILSALIWIGIMCQGNPSAVVSKHHKIQERLRKKMDSESIISSPSNVADYLVKNYEIDNEAAIRLCVEEVETINYDAEMRSYAYWSGDKIADKHNLKARENTNDDSD